MFFLDAQVIPPPSKSIYICEIIIVLLDDSVLRSSRVDYYTSNPDFILIGVLFVRVFIIKKKIP